MMHSVTQNPPIREVWLQQLSDVITDPHELLTRVGLANHPDFQAGCAARKLFPLRVPQAVVEKIKPNDPRDPILLQVITQKAEFLQAPGFTTDPLGEQESVVPGLLHKYHNRALLIVKGSCAINCRYCFRRHFPYQDNQGSKQNWRQALAYIAEHTELNEIIFSGGDPLMAKDKEIDWLLTELEAIPHIQRLRIHSRIVTTIPERVTDALCQRFINSRLQIILVTHVNHANEIGVAEIAAMARLKQARVTLLNQSVLLKGINDNAQTLAKLSNALFDAGILPYYLHLLDKVDGAAHYLISDEEARAIMHELLTLVSGYLVPRLTREIAGHKSKTPIDLKLQ